MSENYINHIALVLDASASMGGRADTVIKVADNQIEYLAARSKELDQETRITVYTFNDKVKCVIYDKDVLRLPSIKTLYRTSGMTALVDAVLKSQDDLALTPEIYGDHAFLTYVLTDGQENQSKTPNKLQAISNRLAQLPDHWTVACFVPDQNGKFEAKKFGFPADNVAIWDATTAVGVETAGTKIRETTDIFMSARSTGTFRGTRNLFSMGSDVLNKKVVKQVLTKLPANKYTMLPVRDTMQISELVNKNGIPYHLGIAYYQLTKPEKIQASKEICVVGKKDNAVYRGAQARQILGLPDHEVRVRPEENPDFHVYVQSTSVNRKLVPGTNVLVMK